MKKNFILCVILSLAFSSSMLLRGMGSQGMNPTDAAIAIPLVFAQSTMQSIGTKTGEQIVSLMFSSSELSLLEREGKKLDNESKRLTIEIGQLDKEGKELDNEGKKLDNALRAAKTAKELLDIINDGINTELESGKNHSGDAKERVDKLKKLKTGLDTQIEALKDINGTNINKMKPKEKQIDKHFLKKTS